jgi:hypothetical protein
MMSKVDTAAMHPITETDSRTFDKLAAVRKYGE